jgi:hypothetical protein
VLFNRKLGFPAKIGGADDCQGGKAVNRSHGRLENRAIQTGSRQGLIENVSHYPGQVIFHEDAARMTLSDAGHILAISHHVALDLLGIARPPAPLKVADGSTATFPPTGVTDWQESPFSRKPQRSARLVAHCNLS